MGSGSPSVLAAGSSAMKMGGGGVGVIVWILFAAGRPGSGSRSVCPTRMPAVRNTRPNVSV